MMTHKTILSANDLISNNTAENTILQSFNYRPLQMLPAEKKDEEWCKHNLDWLEYVGLIQIRTQAKRHISNYKMAYGIIEKNDYVPSVENEYADAISVLTEDEPLSAELKNYPIAPIAVNVLLSEFAKRSTDVSYVAIDHESINDVLAEKIAAIEEILMKEVQMKLLMRMMQIEGQQNSEEYKRLQEMLQNPEALKTLPELEDFYRNNYRTIYEQWAAMQHRYDTERYRLYELENEAFLDLLTVKKEFWHFNMMDDDYDIELWDTVTTFYHRSPNTRFASNCSYIGNVKLMTLQEIIDKYGYYMDENDRLRLESQLPTTNYATALTSLQNDGNFYDKTLPYNENRKHGIDYSRYLAFFGDATSPTLSMLTSDTDDSLFNRLPFFRVTTAYWISFKKVGLLTKIDSDGNRIESIVDESYKIIQKPVYNKTLLNEESERTLIFGEHVEWVWMKETWGGVKIGQNTLTYNGMSDTKQNPIYLGINSKTIRPLKFQFKGEHSIFGAKLPVEGIIDNYRYAYSMSLIDLLKPYQILYNIVNNQIADILLDEIGTVIVLDQNTLPKRSLGEDWGQTPYANAFIAMKNFHILPLDTSLRNTESAINFQHYQQLNLEQTNRLLSRVNLANYFKQEALNSIGITPQRIGTPIGQTQTATEYEQSLISSYSITEQYFITHCDVLMPRVHEMRTQLAQYYLSTNPSFRMQIMLKDYQRILFQIDGTKLFNKDFNVFITTKASHRNVIEQIKRMLYSTQGSGATLYDLAEVLSIETRSELIHKINELKERAEKEASMRYQHELQMKEIERQQLEKEKALERDFKAQENEKERRKDVLVAKIRAASLTGLMDVDKSGRSDFIEYMETIKQEEEQERINNLKTETYKNKNEVAREKLSLEKEKLEQQKHNKLMDYLIAKENKNKYDTDTIQEKENLE